MAKASGVVPVRGGGIGSLFLGVALAASGGYMLATRATVTSGMWYLGGYPSFGLALLPFMLGVGLLVAGRAAVGWTFVVAGLAIVLAGVILNLHLYFRPTTLYEMLVMLALIAAGLGLIARSVHAYVRYGV